MSKKNALIVLERVAAVQGDWSRDFNTLMQDEALRERFRAAWLRAQVEIGTYVEIGKSRKAGSVKEGKGATIL